MAFRDPARSPREPYRTGTDATLRRHIAGIRRHQHRRGHARNCVTSSGDSRKPAGTHGNPRDLKGLRGSTRKSFECRGIKPKFHAVRIQMRELDSQGVSGISLLPMITPAGTTVGTRGIYRWKSRGTSLRKSPGATRRACWRDPGRSHKMPRWKTPEPV